MDRTKRLREWAQMVSQCRGSGKTVDVWCEEHGISRKTYYYRLRRVCNMIPEDNTANLPMPVEKPVFAELAPGEQTVERNSVITVRAGGMEIQIPNGAEPKTIEATLRAVSRIC